MEEYVTASRLASGFSALVPLIMYFTRKKIKQPKAVRFLIVFIVMCGLSDLISWILGENGKTTHVVLNTQDVLQFILLAIIYYKLFLKDSPRFFYITLLVYFIFQLWNTLYIQAFTTEHQTWSWTATGSILFLVSVGFYRHILKDGEFFIKLHHYTPYWINTGVFIYFGFSLWLFAVANYILAIVPKDQAVADLIWSFHNWNNFIKNMVFTIALYYAGKEPVSRLDKDPYKKNYFKADIKEEDKKKKDIEEAKKPKEKNEDSPTEEGKE